MKLNPDAMRKILLFIEEKANYIDEDSDFPNQHKEFANGEIIADEYFHDFNTSEVAYALELLIKEEYVSLIGNALYDSDRNLTYARINGLTWKGHELLDNIRNDTFWNHAKQRALRVGTVSISALAGGAKALATAWMTDPNAYNNLVEGIKSFIK